MPSKRSIAYVRVSTEEQTVQNQITFLHSWAKERHYKIEAIYEDPSVSGRIETTQRPGFQALMQHLQKNTPDAVLIYELTRIGRSFFDVIDAVKTIEHFCPLITCSPNQVYFQTTNGAMRNLLIGIFSSVAEMEREFISQRTIAGLQRARAEGKQIGRPSIIIDPEEVSKLFKTGITVPQVAKELGISKASLYTFLHRQTGLPSLKPPSIVSQFLEQHPTKKASPAQKSINGFTL